MAENDENPEMPENMEIDGDAQAEHNSIEAEGEIDDDVEYVDEELLNQMDIMQDRIEEAAEHTDEEEKKLSEAGDEPVQVDDFSVGRFDEHGDHVYTVAQHPLKPNIMLSGGGDDRVLVWDISGEEKDKHTLFEIKDGFKDSIEYIKFNHNNKYLLITGIGNPIRIYKVNEDEDDESMFEYKNEMETGDDIWFVNWHKKANLFLTGGNDRLIWMFNALNSEYTIYTGHEDVVNNADFTPNGKLIVSISNDWTAKCWDPLKAECLQTIKDPHLFHSNPITSMLLIKDSIVTGDSEGFIFISQYKTGESVGPITKHAEQIESIAGNTGKSIATGSLDGTIKIIDIGKQSLVMTFSKLEDGGGITNLKTSHLNPFLYASSTRGALYWIDMRNGSILGRYTAHSEPIMNFTVNEDTKKAVTAGDDKILYVFDIE